MTLDAKPAALLLAASMMDRRDAAQSAAIGARGGRLLLLRTYEVHGKWRHRRFRK